MYPDTALIVTTDHSVLEKKILGTAGWFPPEQREIPDWITFIRLLGWQARLTSPGRIEDDLNTQSVRWIILTGKPADYQEDFTRHLLTVIEDRAILLITIAPLKNSVAADIFQSSLTLEIISGKEITWSGSGLNRSWSAERPFETTYIEFSSLHLSIARLDDFDIITVRKFGAGKIITLGFHPGEARDIDGIFTALLKHLMIYECVQPVAWYEWKNTMVLRMDDPGSLEVVYNHFFKNAKITETQWGQIGKVLENHKARISLGYVSGWVDDGDESSGELKLSGIKVPRQKGKVYDSHKIMFEKKIEQENILYDYESEFRGIQNLRKKGLAEVELHGYTHLHPDRQSWLSSADSNTNVSWFREFGNSATDFLKVMPVDKQPLILGISALKKNFGTEPCTIIFPGDVFTDTFVEQVLQTKLLMISSYYLAIKSNNQICWAQHVCAPYLDKAESKWFQSELPVIGYFHDFDICINGLDWFSDNLNRWKAAGSKHFIDFRQLAGALSNFVSIQKTGEAWTLKFEKLAEFSIITPIRIGLYIPGDNKITSVQLNGIEHDIKLSVVCSENGLLIEM